MTTVDITPETRAHLVAIGRDHGAAEGREMSPGIRVAAKYHERLVEVLADCEEVLAYVARKSGLTHSDAESVAQEARALLKEIEEAR